jgi:exodeoxyribonuclease-3
MTEQLKLISWNVNGIRAALKKGFMDFFNEVDADIFCLQETKCQVGQVEIDLPGYYQYWNAAVKKGYSGTAIFTKKEPLNVTYDIGIEAHDQEGRVITLEFEDFYMITCYTPNSKRGLERLDNRMEWEDAFRDYMVKLNEVKPVVVCGDLNVAHKEIDLKNPKTNRRNAGFTDEEREKMTTLLDTGFIDTYRYFYPDAIEKYSWWSYMGKARENNTGWRIDYFITTKDFEERLVSADIHMDIMGSDHCPVELVISQ